MNIFPHLARNLLMRSRRKLTATKVVLNILTSLTKDSVLLQQIYSSQVFSLLNKLSKSKASGLDKITARLIRECADLICISICKIFNCSLTTGIFPDDWKCAKVTPLFKQGSSSDMNNYRPISVIPVMMCTIRCTRTYQNIALFQKVNPDFALSILRSLLY